MYVCSSSFFFVFFFIFTHFFFEFYAEIQYGRQQWRESHFCEMSPVHSADAMQVKDFIEIALSLTVSQISAFLRFTQKFKMAGKMAGKPFL